MLKVSFMDLLSHYTKFEHFENMLKPNGDSSEERYLTIWASSAYNMDDQTEMNFGFPFIQYVLREYENTPGLTHKQRVLKIINTLPEIIKGPSETHFLPKTKTPFVISFSQAYEDNYMWEKYGDKGKGICLYFDTIKIEEMADKSEKTFLANIAYLAEKGYDFEVWKSLYEIVINEADKCHVLTSIFKYKSDIPRYKKVLMDNMCPIISALIKDSQYFPEREVRLACIRDESISKQRETENGKIINYIEIKIPLNYLAGVTIGSNFERKNELKEICKKNNIRIIDKSEIDWI